MGKKIRRRPGCGIGGAPDRKVTWNNLLYAVDGETIGRTRSPDRAGAVRKQKIRFVAARHPSKMAPIRGRNDSQIFLGQYRIILSADTALKPSGGNCAVLP